jgi:hypothetical protein
MVKHIYKHRYFYIAVSSVFIVYILPLLFIQLPTGHDIYFHLTRIRGLSDELSMGHFPVRIYSTVFFNYGYAAPLFYGDWLLYFPALLVTAGMNIVTAYKTFICVLIILAALSMYFSGKIIFGDKRAACVASVLYTLSTYFGTDALIRHANGEFQSFIFLPIAFAGLYDILFGEGKRWLLLPLGMCGVLVTHTLTSIMTIFFFAVFTLVFIGKILRQPKKLLFIAASVLVFLLLSASFLFPMIEQLQSGEFLATDGTSANKYGTLEFRSMQTVFSLFWIFNTYVKPWFIPQGVGLAIFVLISLFITYYKKVRSRQSYAFLGLATFALFMTSRYFPWEYLQDICGILQFPWRIMLFAAFFIALFGGAIIRKLQESEYRSVYVLTIILVSTIGVVATLFSNFYHAYTNLGDYSTNINIGNNIGLGEYLPTQTEKSQLSWYTPTTECNDFNVVFHSSRENGCFTLDFSENNGDNTYFELPIIMYKGYRASLETEDGVSELPLTYGINNVIRANVGSEKAGKIKVWYDGTAVQKTSFIITLASFGAVAVYLLFPYIKKRKSENPVSEANLSLDLHF